MFESHLRHDRTSAYNCPSTNRDKRHDNHVRANETIVLDFDRSSDHMTLTPLVSRTRVQRHRPTIQLNVVAHNHSITKANCSRVLEETSTLHNTLTANVDVVSVLALEGRLDDRVVADRAIGRRVLSLSRLSIGAPVRFENLRKKFAALGVADA